MSSEKIPPQASLNSEALTNAPCGPPRKAAISHLELAVLKQVSEVPGQKQVEIGKLLHNHWKKICVANAENIRCKTSPLSSVYKTVATLTYDMSPPLLVLGPHDPKLERPLVRRFESKLLFTTDTGEKLLSFLAGHPHTRVDTKWLLEMYYKNLNKGHRLVAVPSGWQSHIATQAISETPLRSEKGGDRNG